MTIDPNYGYEQRMNLSTIYGTFALHLKYNIKMKRWAADFTNMSSYQTVYGVIMTPGRKFRALRRIGFGGTLDVSANEDILYLEYRGM